MEGEGRKVFSLLSEEGKKFSPPDDDDDCRPIHLGSAAAAASSIPPIHIRCNIKVVCTVQMPSAHRTNKHL